MSAYPHRCEGSAENTRTKLEFLIPSWRTSSRPTTLEFYTQAAGSAQRDAVNLLEEQLFPNVPKLESCGSIAETESQLVQ
jgi:hypothetical protein